MIAAIMRLAPVLETTTVNVTKPDFGAWLKRKIDDAGIRLTEVSSLSKIAYPNLNSIVNSGKKGKPVQPEEATMEKLIPALKALGLISEDAEAWIAAGYRPEGYLMTKSNDLTSEPPENFEDWPSELREALAHARTLSPEAQVYIYKLWREQSRAHADIETMRQEAERQLIERQRELDLLK